MREVSEWIFVFVVCGVCYYCCNRPSNETNSTSSTDEWQPVIEQNSELSANQPQNKQGGGVVNFSFNEYMNSTTNRGESNIRQSTSTEHIDCGRVSGYIDDAYSYIKKAWNASSIESKQYFAKKAEDCLDDAGDECGSLRFHSDDSDNRQYLEYAQRELDDAEDFAQKGKKENDDPGRIDFYLNKCVDEINDAIGYLNKVN